MSKSISRNDSKISIDSLINEKFLKLETENRLKYLSLCRKELDKRTEKFNEDILLNGRIIEELQLKIFNVTERINQTDKNYEAKSNSLSQVATAIQCELSETEKTQIHNETINFKTQKKYSNTGQRNRIKNIEKRISYLTSEHSRILKILHNELLCYKREINKYKLLKDQRILKYKGDYTILQDFINKLQLSLESFSEANFDKDQQITNLFNRRKFSYSSLLEETYYLDIGQRITKPWQFSYFSSLNCRPLIEHPKIGRSEIESRKLKDIIPHIDDVRLHRRFNFNNYINRKR